MKTIRNLYETVNEKNITAIKAEMDDKGLFITASFKDGEDSICRLRDGWDVFLCNELLIKLQPTLIGVPELVEFINFEYYFNLIKRYNELLKIRECMFDLGETDVFPDRIYSYILDKLLAKHKMEQGGYYAAMQKRPLKDWVQEAYAHFA